MSEDKNPSTEPSTNNTTEDQSAEPRHNDIPAHVAQNAKAPGNDLPDTRPTEHGGQQGLDPTRYGDWEKKGRCTDF